MKEFFARIFLFASLVGFDFSILIRFQIHKPNNQNQSVFGAGESKGLQLSSSSSNQFNQATMAMILLLDSLSRCLNGTSNRGGVGASGPESNNPHFPSSDEPAEVQVRLRDHHHNNRRSRSGSKSHDQGSRRRRSTTPKNRNGRRRSLGGSDEEENLELVSATQDDMDALADARRDAHDQVRGSPDRGSPSRLRRRRQRSSPKLTIEERRNDIFRLPSDHPASRPSSPANSTEGSANQNRSGRSQQGRSRSSPRAVSYTHLTLPTKA